MNRDILIPRRARRNPGWLLRLARWVGVQRTITENYFYFRRKGYTRKASWHCAQLTIASRLR